MDLAAGSTHELRLEYFESTGNARLKLLWDAGTRDDARARIDSAAALVAASDVAVIANGEWRYAVQPEIAGVSVSLPVLALESVGIGGGSVIRDDGGTLRIGPDSVGFRLADEALVFGGDTLTATDVGGPSFAISDPQGVWATVLYDALLVLFALAASILSGITLTLSQHVPLDPSITPVVAVLRSNLWLTVHVLTIVASYGALGLATVLVLSGTYRDLFTLVVYTEWIFFALLAVACVGAWTLFFYRREGRRVRAFYRVALICLRVLAVLVLLFVFFQPMLALSRVETTRSAVAVLLGANLLAQALGRGA